MWKLQKYMEEAMGTELKAKYPKTETEMMIMRSLDHSEKKEGRD